VNAVALLRRARARGLVFRLEGDSAQVRGGATLADKAGAIAFLREHRAAVLTVLRAESNPAIAAARDVLGAELVSVGPPTPSAVLPADRVLVLDFTGKGGRHA
jgi:hypothetical protein